MRSVANSVAEATGQRRDIVLAAIDVEKAERSLQHGPRPGEACLGEACRQHAALGGAAHVQALDHRAGARLGELEEACGQRAGDADRLRHLFGVEFQQLADHDGSAERSGGAGRVEATGLVVVSGGAADPDHHLGAGDEGREQVAPADAALLRDRERRREHGCARMHSGVRPGEIVHLEGVRQRAVGERRHRRPHPRAAGRQDAAFAARALPARVVHDDAAPGQA